MEVRETASHMVDAIEGRARAFVQVQNGCDHRCTFCIIPYGRGNSRSVPMGAVVDQVKRLVGNGYAEVVLTGVDMTSYGPDLPGNLRLGKLVKTVLAQVPDLQRLRLSSIDSIEADEDLMEAIASEKRLMPHLHLSLQAGDDMILKRMKRRHLRDDSIRFCQTARALRPDIVFGADIIAGFPTETEEMFQNSLKIVEECGLTHLHVFPYSPREEHPQHGCRKYGAKSSRNAQPACAPKATAPMKSTSTRFTAHASACWSRKKVLPARRASRWPLWIRAMLAKLSNEL